MKLLNLMTTADDSISMLLVGVRPDNKEVGYDFKHKRWLDDNILDNPNRVITVGEFKKLLIYLKNRDCKLEDFSTMKKNHIKSFRNIETYRNTIMIVKIHLSCERFPDMRIFTHKSKGEKKRSFTPKKKAIRDRVDWTSKKIIEEVNDNPNSYRILPGGDIDH